MDNPFVLVAPPPFFGSNSLKIHPRKMYYYYFFVANFHNLARKKSKLTLEGGIYCCKTSPYIWNINPSNNTWKSSYQHVKIWRTLLCRHVSKPYCGRRAARRDCKPRWGYSWDGVGNPKSSKSYSRSHEVTQFAFITSFTSKMHKGKKNH